MKNVFFKKKIFSNSLIQGYLGTVDAGKEYDATELVKKYQGPKVPILIDQVETVISLKKHSVGSCYQYITNLGCGYFSFPLKHNQFDKFSNCHWQVS